MSCAISLAHPGVTGMCLGAPVVPLVVANISGDSRVSTFGLAGDQSIDVRAERLVVEDRDAAPIFPGRANVREPVLAAEDRVPVARHDGLEHARLRAGRLSGRRVECAAVGPGGKRGQRVDERRHR
jgi:hypothetical protein